MISCLHAGDSLSHRLHHCAALMAEDDGEGALGILAGQSVSVGVANCTTHSTAARRRQAVSAVVCTLSESVSGLC